MDMGRSRGGKGEGDYGKGWRAVENWEKQGKAEGCFDTQCLHHSFFVFNLGHFATLLSRSFATNICGYLLDVEIPPPPRLSFFCLGGVCGGWDRDAI